MEFLLRRTDWVDGILPFLIAFLPILLAAYIA